MPHLTPFMSSTKTVENKLRCSVEKACQPIVTHIIKIKQKQQILGVKYTLSQLKLFVLGRHLSVILM